jgi:hypothetical protein
MRNFAHRMTSPLFPSPAGKGEERGGTVVRFWNDQVLVSADEVLAEIEKIPEL